MRPSSRTTRIIGALLAAAMLAACSGGNPSSSSLVPTQQQFKWNGPVGKLNVRFKLPSKKRQGEIANLVSRAETARGMKPNYFPGSATTLTFKLTKINGVNAAAPTPYDFSVALSTCGPACTVVGGTAAAASCSQTPPSTGPWSCTLHTNAPAAADTFTIETLDSGKALSESALVITVTAQTPATGTFALDPVVAKLAWSSGWISNTAAYIGTGTGGSSGGGNGPTEPTWTSGIGYTCPGASGTPPVYCSDPLVNGNSVAINDTLTLSFEDADGNVVLPVSGDASPNIPIFVSNAGVEVNTSVFCNNADLEWLNSSGSTAVSYATLSGLAATDTPNPDLANGAASSAVSATTEFIGAGNPNGSALPQLNSPETGKDGTSGGGTDAKGTVISDSVYGNTGAFLNYDGGGNATSGATNWTCVATTSPAIGTATYHIGLAEGSITGMKTLPIKIHRH